MVLTENQKALVEKIGIYHQSAGMQPAAARVMGLLFVSEKANVAFDEVTETLGISKSATSNAINLLLQTEQIDYTTFSGDRKRYFRLKTKNWRDVFSKRIDKMTGFNVLLREVLETKRSEGTNCNCNDLEELVSFLDFLHQELPLLLAKWEQSRQ